MRDSGLVRAIAFRPEEPGLAKEIRWFFASMIAEVVRFLRLNPGTKEREFARQLGVEKGAVNSLLYKNPETFIHDDEQRWSLTAGTKLTVVLEEEAWVGANRLKMCSKPAVRLWMKTVLRLSWAVRCPVRYVLSAQRL